MRTINLHRKMFECVSVRRKRVNKCRADFTWSCGSSFPVNTMVQYCSFFILSEFIWEGMKLNCCIR